MNYCFIYLFIFLAYGFISSSLLLSTVQYILLDYIILPQSLITWIHIDTAYTDVLIGLFIFTYIYKNLINTESRISMYLLLTLIFIKTIWLSIGLNEFIIVYDILTHDIRKIFYCIFIYGYTFIMFLLCIFRNFS